MTSILRYPSTQTTRLHRNAVSTHRQALSNRRKYAPRTVAVPEEEDHNRAFRSQRFDSHMTSLIGRFATEAGYPDGRRRSRRQPFFDQKTQGVHLPFPLHSHLFRPSLSQSGSGDLDHMAVIKRVSFIRI